jgi:antibiotic biosynthesis monooxygenase (ABM) superfamily enzyme
LTAVTDEPISTVTLRTVRAGQEADFEAALRDFFQLTKDVPGQLGVHVVRPGPGSGSRDYGILRTFCSEEARRLFFESDLFLEWEARAADFLKGERRHQTLTGLETWFTQAGSRVLIPPPRWKMALVSTLGGCLAATLVGLTVGPRLASAGALTRTFLLSLLIAILMTWVMMPLLSRLLRRWLLPNQA